MCACVLVEPVRDQRPNCSKTTEIRIKMIDLQTFIDEIKRSEHGKQLGKDFISYRLECNSRKGHMLKLQLTYNNVMLKIKFFTSKTHITSKTKDS